MVATLWGTAAFKALVGLLALALARPWGRLLPRWILLTAAWTTGGLLTLYGVANFIQHGLMQAGVVHIPDALGSEAVPWHLLWDPIWLVSGILFCLAARDYGQRGA